MLPFRAGQIHGIQALGNPLGVDEGDQPPPLLHAEPPDPIAAEIVAGSGRGLGDLEEIPGIGQGVGYSEGQRRIRAGRTGVGRPEARRPEGDQTSVIGVLDARAGAEALGQTVIARPDSEPPLEEADVEEALEERVAAPKARGVRVRRKDPAREVDDERMSSAVDRRMRGQPEEIGPRGALRAALRRGK